MTLAEKLAKFPTLEDALRDCPNKGDHTPGPQSYLGWHEWARKKGKTHKQKRCRGCGRFLIWVPRAKRAPKPN